jgi:hypothetical protein
MCGHHHAPAALYSRERIPGTHWIENWVEHKAGVDTEAGGKILCLCLKSNMVVRPVFKHYID